MLVDPGGTVMGRAANTEGRTSDCTEHAETNHRSATRWYAVGERRSPLCASTEPCAMCAGTIFWARIGRVVFGVRTERHYDMKGESDRQLRLSCREVLPRGNHEVDVQGLVLEEEAAAVFENGTR